MLSTIEQHQRQILVKQNLHQGGACEEKRKKRAGKGNKTF